MNKVLIAIGCIMMLLAVVVFSLSTGAAESTTFYWGMVTTLTLAGMGAIAVWLGAIAGKKEQMPPTITRPAPIAKQESKEQIVKREEITRKEVIVKIRCPYCQRVYDETLDNCPYCGAKR